MTGPTIVSRVLATFLRRFAQCLGRTLVVAFASVVLWTTAAAAEPTVVGIRMGDQGDSTRLVLDLSESVKYTVSVLDDPYRVVIDLPVVGWTLTPADEARHLGVIERFRYGRFDKDTSRLVLDLGGPVEVARTFVLPPEGTSRYRLVVDLKPVGKDAFVRKPVVAPPKPAAPVIAARPPPARLDKPVIVLDPGHGGVDPGTIGVTGAREKDITLAMARELKAALEASGRYRVVLTRSTDIFIPLQDRVRIAREAGASLFMSLHADSVGSPSISGASIYTLHEKASDKEAEALAAKENRADLIGGLDLGDRTNDVAAILISLVQRETMNLSATFASLLVPEFSKDWHLVRNTHRFAGFAVLKAPDVPSVLVELGYLSNPNDERSLKGPAGRKPVVDAVTRAVNRYFDIHPV
ncbi:MAG: N-acetylmuramoyl-L-alanine amidase [Alphaproteobacteria bacterium]|nr:N-acetylmuramoyl-L-alanine amidase [Alphaproteobacteria bacterium]